jgi:hypothetical protein
MSAKKVVVVNTEVGDAAEGELAACPHAASISVQIIRITIKRFMFFTPLVFTDKLGIA